MIPSKIKIESFAKRCHMGTLGGKGLTIYPPRVLVAQHGWKRQEIIARRSLFNSLSGLGSENGYWTGAEDTVQEGQFRWIDGTPVALGAPFWARVSKSK